MESFTIVDALLTSVIGIATVMVILAIIAVLIIFVSKVIRAFESKTAKSEAVIGDAPVAPAAGIPMPEGMNEGEVELINTDEKTAAVIMALVSHNSGIPLNRLSFKSIKLLDDEKKGADK